MESPDTSLRRHLRTHTRVPVHFFVTVSNTHGLLLHAEIEELSLAAIRLRSLRRLALGEGCVVTIQLVNRHNTDLPVVCHGQVLRHTADGMVVSLDRIEDAEGLANVRNLILLHADDPARAAREMDPYP